MVVLLHSVNWLRDPTRWRLIRNCLSHIDGPKVWFLINEFRAVGTQLLQATRAGATVIASQLPADVAQDFIGPHFSGRVIDMPHALDAGFFRPGPQIKDRPLDIGFRGGSYPEYVGHNDRELLFDLSRICASRLNLRVDVKAERLESDDEWRSFLGHCRAVVGHEAGADYLDMDDSIRDTINRLYGKLSSAELLELAKYLIAHVRPALRLSGRIVAPRSFDAIGTKTCQLLFPGRYNDLLEPNIHYIRLERDFSNLDEVTLRLRDDDYLQRLADHAYEWAMDSQTYAHRVSRLLAFL